MDQLELIDKSIAKLLAGRERLTEGVWFIQPRNLVEEWADEYSIQPDLLFWIFNPFSHRQQVSRPVDIGELQTVVPLMKRKLVSGCVFALTHVDQYPNASIVHLTVKFGDA